MKTFIIGYGRMGQRHHLACQNLNFQVERIYDIENHVETNGIKVTPVSEFLNDLRLIQPELVIISSTAASHYDYLKQCINANVPYVLCEKPLCTSLQQLEDIYSIYQQNAAKTKIAVNHQMRFMDNYTQIKDIIDSGQLGKIASISVQSGNFGAAMNSIHYFEMFRYMTNEYIQKIWGWLTPQQGQNPRGKQYQDHAGCIRAVSSAGNRLYLDFSENQGHGLWVTYTCTTGQIHVDELAGEIRLSYRKNANDLLLPTTRYGMESANEVLKIKPIDTVEPTQKVIKSLLENKNYPTFYDGLMTVKTLIAALASSDQNNCSIELDAIPHSYYQKVFPWA